MPLSAKGEKILSKMRSEYGTKKGTSVFYASRNKGTIKGVESVAGPRHARERDECIESFAKKLRKRARRK
jgi:hypothetical protein